MIKAKRAWYAAVQLRIMKKDLLKNMNLPGLKKNRTASLILKQRAQTGNVFLAFRDVDELNEIIEKWKTVKSPVYNFIAEDNVQHTVWVISDEKIIDKITEIFKTKVPCTYIADGHHRAASAAKVKQELASNEEAGIFSYHFISCRAIAYYGLQQGCNRFKRLIHGRIFRQDQ